jgi:hypothetical protein
MSTPARRSRFEHQDEADLVASGGFFSSSQVN